MVGQSMVPSDVFGVWPRKMFSATVSSGNSSSSWCTVAMPAACASRGEANRTGRAIDEDLALVGLVQAGHDLDEGGLAGAVLAHQGMHLAGAHVEADVGHAP